MLIINTIKSSIELKEKTHTNTYKTCLTGEFELYYFIIWDKKKFVQCLV